MNCYTCDGPQVLIWGGDQDLEDDDDHDIVTNLSCPKCDSIVYVYWSIGERALCSRVVEK